MACYSTADSLKLAQPAVSQASGAYAETFLSRLAMGWSVLFQFRLPRHSPGLQTRTTNPGAMHDLAPQLPVT